MEPTRKKKAGGGEDELSDTNETVGDLEEFLETIYEDDVLAKLLSGKTDDVAFESSGMDLRKKSVHVDKSEKGDNAFAGDSSAQPNAWASAGVPLDTPGDALFTADLATQQTRGRASSLVPLGTTGDAPLVGHKVQKEPPAKAPLAVSTDTTSDALQFKSGTGAPTNNIFPASTAPRFSLIAPRGSLPAVGGEQEKEKVSEGKKRGPYKERRVSWTQTAKHPDEIHRNTQLSSTASTKKSSNFDLRPFRQRELIVSHQLDSESSKKETSESGSGTTTLE